MQGGTPAPQRGPELRSPALRPAGDWKREGDEFVMYTFKVAPCSLRYRHDWSQCPYAHAGERARRRDPKTSVYSAIACRSMQEVGNCALGDACPNAHSAFEYWLHPSRYHTALCNLGDQCRRSFCFFAHSRSELRTPTLRPGEVCPEATAAALTLAPPHLQPALQSLSGASMQLDQPIQDGDDSSSQGPAHRSRPEQPQQRQQQQQLQAQVQALQPDSRAQPRQEQPQGMSNVASGSGGSQPQPQLQPGSSSLPGQLPGGQQPGLVGPQDSSSLLQRLQQGSTSQELWQKGQNADSVLQPVVSQQLSSSSSSSSTPSLAGSLPLPMAASGVGPLTGELVAQTPGAPWVAGQPQTVSQMLSVLRGAPFFSSQQAQMQPHAAPSALRESRSAPTSPSPTFYTARAYSSPAVPGGLPRPLSPSISPQLAVAAAPSSTSASVGGEAVNIAMVVQAVAREVVQGRYTASQAALLLKALLPDQPLLELVEHVRRAAEAYR